MVQPTSTFSERSSCLTRELGAEAEEGFAPGLFSSLHALSYVKACSALQSVADGAMAAGGCERCCPSLPQPASINLG